jgi:hydrogenase/urease accessory protein HupE
MSGFIKWFIHKLIAACALFIWATAINAHEMTITDLNLRETQPGQFVWSWGLPGKSKPVAEDLKALWPEGCVGDERTLRCGPKGLAGTLAVDGMGKNYSAVILRVRWRGGDQTTFTITESQPKVQLFGSAKDDRPASEVILAYGMLGFQHILEGIDHLLFVLSLLFLVGFRRQLLTTITAFTVAHSLTLAASALGALSLRPAPVEAVIALSIVLVCAEALSRKDSLTLRYPAAVAFVFGLVHGLGFAGALKDIGLPERFTNWALVSFNVGVEAGQLLVIAAAWGLWWGVSRLRVATQARQWVLYAMGGMASFWTLSRLVVIAG